MGWNDESDFPLCTEILNIAGEKFNVKCECSATHKTMMMMMISVWLRLRDFRVSEKEDKK